MPPSPHQLHNHAFATTGAEINRIKRNYMESQSRRSSRLRGLNDELQGVQKIMFENIDAALQRGELVAGNVICCIMHTEKDIGYI